MKTYQVVSRGDNESNKIAETLNGALMGHGWRESYNPEIVIAVGGDGTMLEAFHRFNKSLDTTSFVGLHTGHLGFYADWKKDEIVELVHSLIIEEPKIVQYPLIEMTTESGNKYLALNEVTLKNNAKTFIGSVYINGEKFEDFRGDGLCISTPSGSTAYNKSVNGSLIHPSLEAIQLSEIASINNRVFRTVGSSIVLPKHHELEVRGNFEDTFFTQDHLSVSEKSNNFKFKVSDKKVHFARYKSFRFWNRVRDNFII